MPLSDPQRLDVAAQWMRDNTAPVAVVKQAVRATVNAIDDWWESSRAGFVAAIPAGLQAGTAPDVLCANACAIARSAVITDVSAGITDRSHTEDLLGGYTAASSWLTANVAGLFGAVVSAGGANLTQAQVFHLTESVLRQRAA